MMSVPVMSLGIRSGVNCTRLNERSSASATVCTIRVLASPGTPIEERMPAGEDGGEDAVDHVVLADDPLGHLAPQPRDGIDQALRAGWTSSLGAGAGAVWVAVMIALALGRRGAGRSGAGLTDAALLADVSLVTGCAPAMAWTTPRYREPARRGFQPARSAARLRKFSQADSFCPVTNPRSGRPARARGRCGTPGSGVQLAVSLLVFVLAVSGSIASSVPAGIVTVAAAFLGFGGTMYWLIRQLNRKDGGGE